MVTVSWWSCCIRFVLSLWITYPANNSLDGKSLRESDLNLLCAYTLKVEDHLSDGTFSWLAKGYLNSSHDILKMTKKRVQSLAGFRPIQYSCCINSCVCFIGPYENLTECCSNCKESQYKANEQLCKYFDYFPVISQLQAMSANAKHAKEMRYQAEHVHKPGCQGCFQWLTLSVFTQYHCFHWWDPFFYFSDEHDIALSLSTDGFAPFKKHKKMLAHY